jgi:hypothetical protein
MTPKELGELGALEAVQPFVDPADLPPARRMRRWSRVCANPSRTCASSRRRSGRQAKRIEFDFFARPVAVEGEAGWSA